MQTTSVLSLGWREGGPELLARFTAPAKERPALLSRLAAELRAEEVLYLVTCNRVEVAYRSAAALPTNEARRAVLAVLGSNAAPQTRAWRAWGGEGAVEHLFLVAAGLASAKVGETEIAGQLRDALALSRDLGLCGAHLGDFVDEALRCARRVRQETALSEGRTSLAEIALDRLRSHRGDRDAPYRVALVGRSKMTERCAHALSADTCEIHWVNRTPERLQPLAADLGAEVHSLADFCADPAAVDVVVSATGASTPLLGSKTLALLARSGTTLVVDLSVAPDIRAVDAKAAGIEHYGLEEILIHADKTRTEKTAAAAEARILVDDALEQLCARHSARSAGQAASRLHERFRSDAHEAVEEALQREFKHLSGEDADRLRRFTDLLARRLAHDPAKGLRRLAANHGPEAADQFLDGSEAAKEAR